MPCSNNCIVNSDLSTLPNITAESNCASPVVAICRISRQRAAPSFEMPIDNTQNGFFLFPKLLISASLRV